MAFGQHRKIVELAFVDTVGTCADDDSCNLGQFESLRKNLLQPLQRRVCVRIRLKISKVFFCTAVALLMKFDPLFELLANAFLWRAIGGGKSIVIAEGAPSGG